MSNLYVLRMLLISTQLKLVATMRASKSLKDVKRAETGIWQGSCIWVAKCLRKVLWYDKCDSSWGGIFLPKAHKPKPNIAELLDLGSWKVNEWVSDLNRRCNSQGHMARKVNEEKLRPVLITLPPMPKSCSDIFCGSKKPCTKNCRCKKGEELM